MGYALVRPGTPHRVSGAGTVRWLPVAHRFLSRGPLAAILPLSPRRLQLPVPLGLNLLVVPGEHVLRRDVADGTVQADIVVMFHVALHQPLRILQRQRCSRPDALSLLAICANVRFFRSIGNSKAKF